MDLNQYCIVLVNLDPTIGSEAKKTRPCLIISPNEMNKHLQTIIIAPITSSSKNYPTRVEIKGTTTKGWIMIDQIRTIDKKRIIKTFEEISKKEILSVKNVIKETLVL
ncbi:MAG: type II toxin-antitoxin system PemK/MazF family toxin [Bacteroidota bacterium]|nr:type II toxin-antitoxin system PemK/MazF family toxin [Bacteroidota bacterium]